MTHVSLDDQPIAVRQFFRNLPAGLVGSVAEMGGRPVARVLPPSPPANGATDAAAKLHQELMEKAAGAGS